jgi:hypothetical protein
MYGLIERSYCCLIRKWVLIRIGGGLTDVLSIFGKENTSLIESVEHDAQANHVIL